MLAASIRADEARTAAARPRAKACLLVYLDGGPSRIELFELKPQAPSEIRGPYRPIATTVLGLTIGELLPQVTQHAHCFAQIRSVRHEEKVHDPAVYQMLTGYKHPNSAGELKVELTDHPHVGSALLLGDRSSAAMPKANQLSEIMKMETRVLPGQNGGILGPAADPFLIDMSRDGLVRKPQFRRTGYVSISRLESRSALLREFNH